MKFASKKSILFGVPLIIFLAHATNVFGQGWSYTGFWRLEKRVSLSGTNYDNGIPEQIKVRQYKDSAEIVMIILRQNGMDTVHYFIKMDGIPFETISSSGKLKKVSIEWLESNRGFNETAVFTDGNEVKPHHIATSRWRLIDGGKSFEVTKEVKYANSDENWSMTGVYGRIGKGVQFEQGLSWRQILNKAKVENKYVFVDCYASWCVPCKRMDREVYPMEKVSDYINARFVSIKLQMDTTGSDTKEIKDRHADVHFIRQQYGIVAYPTFLFFSPQGKLVHRAMGYQSAKSFIDMASAATDPSRQYYTLLENYQEGKKDYSLMPYFAVKEKEYGDKELANIIAKDYKDNVLDTLDALALKNEKVIDFVGNKFPQLIYEDGSKGRLFKLFYQQGNTIDSVMNAKGYADYYVRRIIKKEEIEDKIWRNDKLINKNPDWVSIRATIRSKYNNNYAEDLVRDGEMSFYKKTGNWAAFVKMIDEQMNAYPPKADGKDFMNAVGSMGDDLWALNGLAWETFEACNDKVVLRKALEWADQSIKLGRKARVNWLNSVLDTKANLLYKLGRVDEAIACQQKAIKVVEEAILNGTGDSSVVLEHQEVIKKMRNGIPTWPVDKKH